MSIFLDVFVMILFVIRLLLTGIIIFSPILLYLMIQRIVFSKYRKELKVLRSDTYGKWGRKDALDIYESSFTEYIYEKNKFLGVLRILSVTFLIFLCLSVMKYENSDENNKEYLEIRKELHSMKDNQGFYITGTRIYIDGADEIVYYFTEKIGENSYKQKRLKAEDCSVVEQDIEEPYVVHKCYNDAFLLNKWHSFITLKLFPYEEPSSYSIESSVFYIPYNSVNNSFEIDNN